jgi:hypothetical protein
MASGIICQGCGIEAPTRSVDFRQNIGMLIMRTHKRIKGMLCKNCVHKHFWQTTATTLFLGPWGYISIIVSPIFIINNVVRYLSVIGMPPVPAGATIPVLNDDAIKRLNPYSQAIIDRLNLNEPVESVATDIGKKAGVTPGQVLKYAIALSRQRRSQPPTGGFPVVMPPAKPTPVVPLELEQDFSDVQLLDEPATPQDTEAKPAAEEPKWGMQ